MTGGGVSSQDSFSFATYQQPSKKKYAELVLEGDGFEDDPDAYEAENIFFVPQEARWSEIAKAVHTRTSNCPVFF